MHTFRWVDENLIPYEGFIRMHTLKNSSDVHIILVIKGIFIRKKWKIGNVRGQCHDETYAMAGSKSLNRKYLFTHCYGNVLNLVLGNVIWHLSNLTLSNQWTGFYMITASVMKGLTEILAAAYKICKLVKKLPKRNAKLDQIWQWTKNE